MHRVVSRVDQLDGDLAGYKAGGYGGRRQREDGPGHVAQSEEKGPGQQDGEKEGQAEIAAQGKPVLPQEGAAPRFPAARLRRAGLAKRGPALREQPFKLRQPGVDQIIAHMCVEGHFRAAAAFLAFLRLPRRARLALGQREGGLRHVLFGQGVFSGQPFHHMAVVIAGVEIGTGIDARGIAAQDMLDHANFFHEVPPVLRPEQAQAGHAVADGDLIRGLLLRVELDELIDAQPGLGQKVLDPAEGQREGGVLALQPPRQFRDESARHGRFGGGQFQPRPRGRSCGPSPPSR